jgi:hypothetical protein
MADLEIGGSVPAFSSSEANSSSYVIAVGIYRTVVSYDDKFIF